MKYLGIDLGVSFIKIGVLSDERVSDVRRAPSPKGFDHIFRHETDPDEYLVIVSSLIDEYLHRYKDISRIYFSTQMHGFVLVDEFSNKKSNYISWKDRRSEDFQVEGITALEWLKNNLSEDLLSPTGMKLRTGLPLVNMFVLQKQNKIDNKMMFGTIGDYIVSKLTDTKISTSLSNAAGTGLFDLENNIWHEKLIDFLGIRAVCPEVKRKHNNLPVGVYRGVGVYPPIGDQQAALLGLDEDYSKVAISNIATGSQSTVVSDKIIFNDHFQTRPFVDGCYLLTIPFIPAGRILNSLIDFIRQIGIDFFSYEKNPCDLWTVLIKFTDAISLEEFENNSLLVNTDFIGSFDDMGGSVNNIDEHNFTTKQLVAAFIFDITQNHIKSLGVLENYKQYDAVVLSGGLGSKLKAFTTLFGNNLAVKVRASNISEDALNGLRLLAKNNIYSW